MTELQGHEDRLEISANSGVFVRSREEGSHGRSRVGGSAPPLCQRAGCYQSHPWDLPVGPVLSGCVELGARHRFSLRLATRAEIKWYLPVRSVNVMFRTSPWCLPSILY